MTADIQQESTMKGKLISLLEVVQPVFTAPVFLSTVTGSPPVWAAWLIAVVPWVLYIGLAGRFIRRTPFDTAIIVYLIGLLIGLMVSPDRVVSSEVLLTTLASILIYYGLVNNINRGHTYWLTMSSISGIVVLGLIIWFFSQGEARHIYFNEWVFKLAAALPKTKGPVLQHNSIGMLLAVVAPLPIAIALFNKGLIRWITLTAGLFLLVILFLTTSGSGWGSVVCGIIFVLAAWRLWTLGLIVPVLGIGMAVIAINYYKFFWPSQVFATGSLAARVSYWLKTFDLMKESWFTGLGPGAWSEVVFGSGIINAHNSYIQLYADTGVTGVLAAILALASFLWISWRIIAASRQSYWRGIGIGIIGSILAGAAGSIFETLITGSFRTPEYHYMSIPLLWILAALLVTSYYRLRGKLYRQDESHG